MTTRRFIPASLMMLFGFVLLGAASPADRKKATEHDATHLTGVLKSIDPAHGTFTLEQVGVDVDEALSQRLKERGAKDAAADAGKTQVIAINAKTKIYIKFRTSPSVANNVEQELKDLQKMIGYPVTIEIAHKADPPVAAKVTAWRGTPWKLK